MKAFTATIFFLSLTNIICAQGFSIDTTLVNNKLTFHIEAREVDSELVLLTSTYGSQIALKDTIDAGGLFNIRFPDFNKDGYSDIKLIYSGNNFTYFLYLFDPSTNMFKSVEGFLKYSDAVQLKSNPKYYYSYHRAGCADMNWVSDLFKIETFKTIQLGHIDGQGCEAEIEESPQVIEIYKVQNNDEEQKMLIKKLPYLKYIPDFGDKWNFIKEYWNKNYGQFE